MKIFLVGGTGGTGRELIEQGLERGHLITALVRNPKKLRFNHANLTVVQGDVLIPDSLDDAMNGQDAVLSALGHKKFIIPTTVLTRGTKNLIDAMNKNKIRRFICISSLGVNDSRFKLGLYYTLFTIPVILFFYFLDRSRQEKLIMKSDLDWTIIRPGQLTNGRKRTDYKHGPTAGSYILTKTISRASVAHFMLSQLEDPTYIRRAPGLTN
jgi:uncharacterized protein YbjT (DUF2867 family)